MKIGKRIVAIIGMSAMFIGLCGFTKTDIGINLKNSSGKLSVFKEITVSESDLTASGKTKEKFVNDIRNNLQNDWSFTKIERNENGKSVIGGSFEVVPQKKKLIGGYCEIAANFDAEFYYSPKTSLGKKTITVKVKPNQSQGAQFVSEFLGNGKEAGDEYNFVIKTPRKITSSTGVISADGKTATFDIKDIIVNKETAYLTVSYVDYTMYLVILVIIAIIVGVVFLVRFLKSKKDATELADNTITPYVAPKPMKDSDDLFGTVTERTEPDDGIRKCPECGYPLKDDDTFCVNCGKFFE